TGNSLESFGDDVDGVDFVGVKLRWKQVAELTKPELTLAARGSCVEVVNLALALDVDYSSVITAGIPLPELAWTDVTPTSVTGGNTLVTGNTINSEWKRTGGI